MDHVCYDNVSYNFFFESAKRGCAVNVFQKYFFYVAFGFYKQKKSEILSKDTLMKRNE